MFAARAGVRAAAQRSSRARAFRAAAGPRPSASDARAWRALLAEKDERLRDKDEAFAREREFAAAAFARERAALQAVARKQDALVARALLDADLAAGAVTARARLERAITTIWDGRARRSGQYDAPTKRLAMLLTEGETGACPGLIAYLRVAADDNDVPPAALLACARGMYEALCKRLHADAAEGSPELPGSLFDGPGGGRPLIVAFAAVLRFSGRDATFRFPDGAAQPVVLRDARACGATEEEVRASRVLE